LSISEVRVVLENYVSFPRILNVAEKLQELMSSNFCQNKIDRIMIDSDGNIQPILDLIIESGITGHWPLEVNAGMDVREIRSKYGKKLFLGGNFDKREIEKGGEAMRKEIDSKLPPLKESGGYIPGLDHDVPVSFTLERFKEYADYLKKQLAE
jgi:uroporphyrinogen-III decarboxylase